MHLNEFQWSVKEKVGQKVEKQNGRKVKRRKEEEQDSEDIQTTANELLHMIEKGGREEGGAVSSKSFDTLNSMIYDL